MHLQRDKFGRFVKGVVPWNKGKTNVYSKEVLKLMREAKIGKHLSPKTEFKKGIIPWNKNKKGIHLSPETEFKEGHSWPKEIKEKMLKNSREKTLLRPNLEMTENLAYIVGLLKGDGCVTNNDRSYKIQLHSIRKKIAMNLLSSLMQIGLNPFINEIIPTNGIGKKKQFRVTAHSKIFYEWYKKLTIEDLEKLLDSQERIIGFLRGFYEAEGCITEFRTGVFSVSMWNTDLELIRFVKRLTEKLRLHFNFNGPYKNNGLGGKAAKPIYRVTTGAKNEVSNFLKLVNPSVKNLNEAQS